MNDELKADLEFWIANWRANATADAQNGSPAIARTYSSCADNLQGVIDKHVSAPAKKP
jgi:hypothetical protein